MTVGTLLTRYESSIACGAIQVGEESHLITQWDWRMCMVKTKRSAVLQNYNSSPHQRSETYKHNTVWLDSFRCLSCISALSHSRSRLATLPLPAVSPTLNFHWLFFMNISKNPSWVIVSPTLNPSRGLWLGVVIPLASGNPGLGARDSEIGQATW